MIQGHGLVVGLQVGGPPAIIEFEGAIVEIRMISKGNGAHRIGIKAPKEVKITLPHRKAREERKEALDGIGNIA